jgi:hypothetical protein
LDMMLVCKYTGSDCNPDRWGDDRDREFSVVEQEEVR